MRDPVFRLHFRRRASGPTTCRARSTTAQRRRVPERSRSRTAALPPPVIAARARRGGLPQKTRRERRAGAWDFAQKRPIILRRMFTTRCAITAATVAVIAAIAPIADVARAHEPDAEEIALGSLVDAELAFARMASEQGIRAAFLASFASDGVVFE